MIQLTMKTLYKIFSIFLLGALLLVGCKDDDFVYGPDNYITSFVLEQSGASYEGTVSDNVITLAVPDYISLEGATVKVGLSKNAQIVPDPASISNWDEDIQFVVTSYDGEKKSTYKYVVERKSVNEANSVVLETQAEVDAFGERGVTSVGGNLVIGRPIGNDSIRSLASLAKLKEIGYSLIINPTYASEDLTGLDNLEKIGNTLQIESVAKLTSVKLPKLKNVGSLTIKNTLIQVVQFPELEYINQSADINCPLGEIKMPNLKSLKGSLSLSTASNSNAMMKQISFPMLEELGNLYTSYFKSMTRMDFPSLKSIGSMTITQSTLLSFINMPQLETITGTVTIPNQSVLSEVSFPALISAKELIIDGKTVRVLDFPKLTTVTGKLYVQNILTSDISSAFPSLAKVDGELQLRELANMTVFKLPTKLKAITKLSIYNRTTTPFSQVDVKGLSIGELNLMANAFRGTKVIGDNIFHGTLTLSSDNATSPYPTFPTLEGFAEVDSLSFGTYISYITDLNIKGIKKINKGLTIPNNNIQRISIVDLEEVGGSFSIGGFTNTIMETPSIEILTLKKVGKDFSIMPNSVSIKKLNFPALESIGGSLTVGTGYSGTWTGNREINTLSFSALKTIGNTLKIFVDTYSNTNSDLTNLDGFSALQQVKAVHVEKQTGLVSYEGLKKALASFSASTWTVSGNGYNPSYDDLKNGNWIKP